MIVENRKRPLASQPLQISKRRFHIRRAWSPALGALSCPCSFSPADEVGEGNQCGRIQKYKCVGGVAQAVKHAALDPRHTYKTQSVEDHLRGKDDSKERAWQEHRTAD